MPRLTDGVGLTLSEYGDDRVDKNFEILDKRIASKFAGGTWSALGDSLTQGYGAVPYVTHVAKEKNIKAFNCGISGTTIAMNPSAPTKPSFIERFAGMEKADLITIFGGSNDWGANTPLGAMGSTDNTTFYGALNNLCWGLYANYGTSKIAFFTPLPQRYMSANAVNKTMDDYVKAIKEVAALHCFPVLDLYTVSNLNFRVPDVSDRYSLDGIHPNDAGHEHMLAPKISSFIETL